MGSRMLPILWLLGVVAAACAPQKGADDRLVPPEGAEYRLVHFTASW